MAHKTCPPSQLRSLEVGLQRRRVLRQNLQEEGVAGTSDLVLILSVLPLEQRGPEGPVGSYYSYRMTCVSKRI
jgi:hypothetical protein